MKLWKAQQNKVECLLCPRQCLLEDGETGPCFARKASINGIGLDWYGQVSSVATEPIEKKPFKQFLRGTRTLSVGFFGCSLNCDFCENNQISQCWEPSSSRRIYPHEIMDMSTNFGCRSICLTYNEPTIHYEYIIDLSELCKGAGRFFVLKTNGYVNKDPWRSICKVVDAMNIDWKGGPSTFRQLTGGSKFFNIYYNIKIALEEGVHVEMSVPIYSRMDRDKELSLFASTLADLDKNIPCHLIPITPSYKMEDSFPTTKEEILKAKDILSKHLTNIYI